MRLSAELSPCRTTGRHGCSEEHAETVRDYREHRRLWEEGRERTTGLYTAEVREYGPGPTFKEWLRWTGRLSYQDG